MQERHRFYKGSVIQRRVPQFTGGESMGDRRKYVVQILYASQADLTADQVKLDPSMGVSDIRFSLRLPIDMVRLVPARLGQAHHRR
jgi:hypothetical protein